MNVNDIPSTSYSRQSAFNCEAGKTFVPFSQQKQDWPALVVTGKTFRILNLIGKGGSSSVRRTVFHTVTGLQPQEEG